MKLIALITTALTATGIATAIGGPTDEDAGSPRVAVVADPQAASAAREAVLRAEDDHGIDGQLRLPRSGFERATNVRYLDAIGYEVLVVQRAPDGAAGVLAAVRAAAGR